MTRLKAMRLFDSIFCALLLTALVGCNSQSESNSSSHQSQEALTSTLSAKEEDGVLTVVNSDNKHIVSLSNYNSYKISKHIVAIQFTDQGERVVAYNSNGKMIFNPTSPNVNSYKISDNIVAVQLTESGERVIAKNSHGEMIFSPTSPSVNSYFVINDYVGIQHSDEGERLNVIKNNKQALLSGELISTYSIVKNNLIIETYDGQKTFTLIP